MPRRGCGFWIFVVFELSDLGFITPVKLQGGPPTSYKYGYKSTYRGYNPSYPIIRPFIGVITPFITSRGPPCNIAGWNDIPEFSIGNTNLQSIRAPIFQPARC